MARMVKLKFLASHTLLAAWLGWLITAAGRQVSDVLKTNMETWLGLETELEVSIVIDLSFWVGYIITALLLGIYSDKIGRKKIIFISLLLFSIPTGLIAVITQEIAHLFIIIRFFQGLSIGGFFPVAIALLGDMNEVQTRSKAVSRFISGGIFGAILGWMVSAILNDIFHSWQLGFLVFVPPIIGIAIINYYFVEESPKIKKDFENHQKSSISIIKSVKTILKNKFLVIALLFCGLDLFTLWLVDDWSPYYVIKMYEIPPDQLTLVALFRATSALAGIIGILFFGYFSDKFGRKKTLYMTIMGGFASIIAFLIVSSSKLNFILLYPIAATIGFFTLGEFAAIYVLVMENAPSNRYGTAMGLCICIGNAIALSGGPIASALSAYTILSWQAFLILPLIALAIRVPLSLIAKDPAYIGISEKK